MGLRRSGGSGRWDLSRAVPGRIRRRANGPVGSVGIGPRRMGIEIPSPLGLCGIRRLDRLDRLTPVPFLVLGQGGTRVLPRPDRNSDPMTARCDRGLRHALLDPGARITGRLRGVDLFGRSNRLLIRGGLPSHRRHRPGHRLGHQFGCWIGRHTVGVIRLGDARARPEPIN
ncbi:MAG: hypothetical protein IRY99_19415, partial [Isosphaeraceae bacterium]|nr:hypothetical protein [Isosphaeraceae bacterium]